MRVATLDVLVRLQDQASRGLATLGDKIRFTGARLRNAGIGLTIAMAPLALGLQRMVSDAMEYEQVSRGIQKVSVATGRDIGQVMGIIDKHSGEMSSRLDMTRGTLKLLSTDLSNVQIDQFIRLVKDGATAMGEDFGTQMSLVTRGFKQLNPNVIDNIGINVRMKDIYKKVAATGNQANIMYANMIIQTQDLSDEQKEAAIEQALFTDMQRKGAVFSGIYADTLNTTAGRVAQLRAKLQDLSVELGTMLLPHVGNLADKLLELIKRFQELRPEIKETIITKLAFGIALGAITALVLMLGGNFLWAAGQITLFATGMKGLTLYTLPLAIANFAALGVIFVGLWMSTGVIVKILSLLRDIAVDIGIEFSRLVLYINKAQLSLAQFGAQILGDDKAWEILDRQIANVIVELDNLDARKKKFKDFGKDFENMATYPWRTLGEEGRLGQDIKDWWNSLFVSPEATTSPALTGEGGAGAGGATETNMYGDFIYNDYGDLGPEGGSYRDIERLIASLQAVIDMQKNG